MSDTVETTWEIYDAAKHRGEGGNYMFLLKPFANAPYYAGIAKDFAERFATHQRHFSQGRRTFMRRAFIDGSTLRSHAGFAHRWHHYSQLSQTEQERLIWVPTPSGDDAMRHEGEAFRQGDMILLVSTRGDNRAAVEKRVQLDIIEYHNGFLEAPHDWKIPRTRSRLVGQGPRMVTTPTVLYSFGRTHPVAAARFFPTLATMESPRRPS